MSGRQGSCNCGVFVGSAISLMKSDLFMIVKHTDMISGKAYLDFLPDIFVWNAVIVLIPGLMNMGVFHYCRLGILFDHVPLSWEILKKRPFIPFQQLTPTFRSFLKWHVVEILQLVPECLVQRKLIMEDLVA